jgi:hypothetical protein
MSRKNYTFHLDYDVMHEFRKVCFDYDLKFSDEVEKLIELWLKDKVKKKDDSKKI